MLILYPIRQQALSFTPYQWNHIIQQWLTSEANVIEKKNPVPFFCKMRFIQQSWRELPFWENKFYHLCEVLKLLFLSTPWNYITQPNVICILHTTRILE